MHISPEIKTQWTYSKENTVLNLSLQSKSFLESSLYSQHNKVTFHIAYLKGRKPPRNLPLVIIHLRGLNYWMVINSQTQSESQQQFSKISGPVVKHVVIFRVDLWM